MFAKTDWFNKTNSLTDQVFFYILAAAFFTMPMGTSWGALLGVVAGVIWLFTGRAWQYRRVYYSSSWCRPVLFLMVIPWICLAWSPDPGDMGIGYAKKIHYWIYGLAFAAMAFDTYSPDAFIKAFLAGLSVNFCWAVVQMAGLFPYGVTGPTGFGRGYSTLTAYLIVGMLMASFYFSREKGKSIRPLYAVLTAIFFFHMIALGGRTGYVAFIALCPLIIRNFMGRVKPVKIAVAGALLLAVMFASPVVRDRVALSVDQVKYHLHADPDKAWGKTYSVHQDRFYMWYGAYELIRDHSFLGVGTGGYQKALKQRRNTKDPDIAHPHNDFLHLAVSYGLLGVFGFLWFYYEMIKNGRYHRDRAGGYFVLSVALVMLVSGVFNTQLLDAGTVFLISLAAGMQQSLPRTRDEKETI